MNQTHAQKYQETFENKYFCNLDEFEPTTTIDKKSFIKYEVKFKDHSTINCVMTNVQRKEIEKLPLFKDILMLRGMGLVKIKETKTVMRETQTTIENMTMEDIILIHNNKLPVTLKENVIEEREQCFLKCGFPVDKRSHFGLEKNIGKKLYISEYGERIGKYNFVRLIGLDLEDSDEDIIESNRIPIPISTLEPYLIPEEEAELDIMRTKTNNPHRLEENPMELLILKEWLDFNKDDSHHTTYKVIALPADKREANFVEPKDEVLINSAMQWLGTPVGMQFLGKLVTKKEIKDRFGLIENF